MKFPEWLTVYGDRDYREPCPTESSEQIAFFNQLERIHPALFEVALHPRNEGKRTPGQVLWQKLEGMNTGAADIIIPGGKTFVCEMKRENHTLSTWRPKQLAYLKSCHNAGAFVCVSLGHAAALDAILDWLERE